MAGETGWEQQLKDAASHAEQDLRRLVGYINDEVVPEVRRNGSEALRKAAAELHRLAEKMDAQVKQTTPPPGSGEAPGSGEGPKD